MAAGDKLGTSTCDCGEGGKVEWTENKSGGGSGKCLSCGEQRFKRSPKARAGLDRQLKGAAPASSSASSGADDQGGAKKGGLFGEPFDLTKL